MKKILFLLFLIPVAGKSQVLFVDSLFADIKKSTYTYKDTLQLDVYTAKDNHYVNERPLLLVVHGGGFGAGRRDSPLETAFCTSMAKKGYLVASMSYRLTLKGKSFGCDCSSTQKIETFRAATEDILDALYYLNASKKLEYNRKEVVLIGSSAGAEAVLNTAFMQQYFAFNNSVKETVKISGVVSLAGAMVDADYITEENAVPTLLVHGMKDPLVPYATAAHHYCPSETKGYIILDGGRTVANKLNALHTSYLLAYAPKGNHDWASLGFGYTTLIARFIRNAIIDMKSVEIELDITEEQK